MALDPKINEPLIIEALDTVSSIKSSPRIISGTTLAVMDGFDRRIDRDPFQDMVELSMRISDALGRLGAVEAIKNIFKEGRLDEPKLNAAIKELTERAEANRIKMLKSMELVIQCPTPRDSKH